MTQLQDSATKQFKMNGYLYVHRAMRSDISNLEATSRRLARLSEEDSVRLQRWFRFFWDMVEVHHQEEDNQFFPTLARRDPGFIEKMDHLTAEHQALHQMVDEIGNSLAQLQTVKDEAERNALSHHFSQLVNRFQASLNDHLAKEELLVIATVVEHFSLKEQKEMEDKTMKSMPRKHIALLVPWVGSTMSAEESAIALKTLPLPIRIMNNLSWKKKYEKFTAVFRA